MPPSEQNENCKVEVDGEKREERVHTIVIDASSFTFIDSVGLSVLPSVSKSFIYTVFDSLLCSLQLE